MISVSRNYGIMLGLLSGDVLMFGSSYIKVH